MRVVASAIASLVAGCISINGGGGLNNAIGDAPDRVGNAQYSVGTYVRIKDAVVVEPRAGLTLGPLGEKSEPLLTFGLRTVTHSHRWRPGYFGMFEAGNPGHDFKHPDRDVEASIYRVGAGVSWDVHHAFEGTDPWWYDGWGVVALGVVYTHESQDGLGAGDFLGLEVNVTLGFSVMGLVAGLSEKH
jgi:hypothetical protein